MAGERLMVTMNESEPEWLIRARAEQAEGQS